MTLPRTSRFRWMQENQFYYFLRCPYGDILCGLLFLGRDRLDYLGPVVCSQHLHRNYEGSSQ